MDNKDKIIEEMAKDIHYAITKECDLNTRGHCYKCEFNTRESNGIDCQTKLVAKILTKLNYRKLPKDSVVLSKEEYEKLKYTWITDSDAYKKGSKETAEKIIKWFKENSVCIPSDEYINEFAKQFGVEIKE
jgi:hypothetical protein